ncbi:MAG: AI-2E family transporter [Acidimicrobiales bacterium]
MDGPKDAEPEPTVPSRTGRMLEAAADKGIPLRTILAVDAVVILTWLAYLLIGRLREVILWVLTAAFVALVLNPAVNFLQRHSFRRGAAVGLVFAVAVVAFAGVLGLFGYPLVNALTRLAEELPHMVSDVRRNHGWLAHTLAHLHLLSWVQRNAPKLDSAARSLSKPALGIGANLGKAVFSTILALITIGFLSLFMLLEAPRLRRGVLGVMRPARRAIVEEIARRVSRQVTAYVIGTVSMSVLFGVVVMVTLFALGVPFALLLGLWVALVAMIPLVGGLVAGVPAVVIALLHTPTAGIVVLIVFVGFQLIENHFLYPVVMSRSVRMNPLWVLLSVLIGANLGGVFGSSFGALIGALVAIPVGGAIQVVFREIWEQSASGTIARSPSEGDPEVEPAVGTESHSGTEPASNGADPTDPSVHRSEVRSTAGVPPS